MSTMYGTPVDAIAEGVLRGDVAREVHQIMSDVRLRDLSAVELLGILVILRGAAERLDAEQRTPAAVLELAKAPRRRK